VEDDAIVLQGDLRRRERQADAEEVSGRSGPGRSGRRDRGTSSHRAG
jgi:hypothetical protein